MPIRALAGGWPAVLIVLVIGRVGLAGPTADPLAGVDLPEAWKTRFWASPDGQALLAIAPSDLAKLVPVQAGIHHCGCPACGASEHDNPLEWSFKSPDVVTCRRCQTSFPNDKFPAKVEPAPGKPPAIPVESIEVRAGVIHSYPYHLADATRQRYPDERFYLAAKRDDEARRFLSRAALYLAVRSREDSDQRLAVMAGVLILRFAQVYPNYATHYDAPGRPKAFQPANLRPPYRAGYATGKWDHNGALEVPLNLLLAYAIVRQTSAIAEAGKILDDAAPARTIERDLFRAAARFVRDQPDDPTEAGFYAVRGLLAVGRLLGDAELTTEATRRLSDLMRQGFSHDGVWRDARGVAQRRVVWMLDAWIDPWLPATEADETKALLALAREVPAPLDGPRASEDVMLAAWPAASAVRPVRRAALLGGAGVARLAVGSGPTALDLELRGTGDDGTWPSARLSLRAAVGGQPVLGDLDDLPSRPDGLERATASHNAVLIDGLNQRESLRLAAQPAAGADIVFFAADSDFQIALLDDPRAYPISSQRYRKWILASSGPIATYAVSVSEIQGGLQHDQVFAAAPGHPGYWQLAGGARPGPRSLLAPTLLYLPEARAEDGRWFVQALGSITDLAYRPLEAPTTATLVDGPRSLRLHLLGDVPATAFVGRAPAAGDDRRGMLVIRRRSGSGETLTSRYVTVLEPGGDPALRVGRVESPAETVLLVVIGSGGTEHIAINLNVGTEQTFTMMDGRRLVTDGLAVRVRGDEVVLAGGTFAEVDGFRTEQTQVEGAVVLATGDEQGRGVFTTDAVIPEVDLRGRALLIRHGDGTTRGWTVTRIDRLADGSRIHVRERPGFRIDRRTGEARYDQFPGTSHPGPHRFAIATLGRGEISTRDALTTRSPGP